jgi:hypothetical protein
MGGNSSGQKMWLKPLKLVSGGSIEDIFSNSKSLMLSPVAKDLQTKPSILGSSVNSSFDAGNGFSFNNEENGSNYYAFIGPDGRANSYVKIGLQQY